MTTTKKKIPPRKLLRRRVRVSRGMVHGTLHRVVDPRLAPRPSVRMVFLYRPTVPVNNDDDDNKTMIPQQLSVPHSRDDPRHGGVSRMVPTTISPRPVTRRAGRSPVSGVCFRIVLVVRSVVVVRLPLRRVIARRRGICCKNRKTKTWM